MNFIGHAFVSGSYDLFMAGHLLGDASNGALLEGAPDRLLKGVRAHHALDRFTDRHPAFMEGSAILSETGGRYGPVLMDVAMDYFLVLHWERWHDEIFSGFVDRVYDVLRMQASVFPGAMGKLAEGIVERDYFGRFTSMESLAFVFQRLAGRTSRPHLVREAGEVVKRHAGTLERLTLAFLDDPGIREYSAGCCAPDIPSGKVSPGYPSCGSQRETSA